MRRRKARLRSDRLSREAEQQAERERQSQRQAQQQAQRKRAAQRERQAQRQAERRQAQRHGGLQIQPDDELKFRRAFAAPACASPALPPRQKHDVDAFPLPPSPLDGAVELSEKIPATIRLYNSGNEEIAFKIKTTERGSIACCPTGGSSRRERR